MPRFKITVLDQQTDKPVAEIKDYDYWPEIRWQVHFLSNGSGVPLKVERVLDATSEDTCEDIEAG